MAARFTPSTFRALGARQFSSLAIFNYRVYFLGQLVSLIGTWMQTTAQAWLVLKLTGSPLALGTVTTLQFLPITVFTLFGGAFADRVPKRRVLIITQSLSMLQAFTLGLLVLTGTVHLWHVYALALMLGTINAFDGPVRQAFGVELVGREQVVNAVALNSSIFNMARIAGPAVAGVAIATVGMSTAFLINAASYIAVLGAYAIMRPEEFFTVPKRPPTGNVLHQIRQGISYSVRTPGILFFFILLAFFGTFGFNFTVLIPLVAEFVLKVDAKQFGFLTSAMGAGSLLAALGMAAVGRLSVRGVMVAAGAFIVVFVGIAVSHSYYLTAAMLVVLGVVSVLFSTTINTTLQITVPDELRGRVMSIFFLLFAGSTPIGGYLTGVLAETFGVTAALVVMASICGTGLVTALVYRQVTGLGWSGEVKPAPLPAPVEGTPLKPASTP
ncbi:MAG: MFS transporter [Dehalococcoidia bacterium]